MNTSCDNPISKHHASGSFHKKSVSVYTIACGTDGRMLSVKQWQQIG